jgi:CrcB protein
VTAVLRGLRMNEFLLVAAGGALGASARHLVGVVSLRAFGSSFPAGTFIVNVVGSLAMGIFIGLLAIKLQGSEALRFFVATGFLGGFTTFSTFSLDFNALWERGDTLLAIGYVLASVVLALGALMFGMWLVRVLT